MDSSRPDALRLLDEIRQVADRWRATDPASAQQAGLVEQFQSLLSDLYGGGWDDVLGWQSELPDEFLPQRYVDRRAERIDGLEIELARSAEGWRRSKDNLTERDLYYEAYATAMEELFRIGHWSGEPDAESQLPYDLMPQVYKEFWREKAGR
jgi:hypothetical protein